MEVYLSGVDENAVAETNGISYNIYFCGCSIRCPECHNKDLWDMKAGTLTDTDAIIEGVKSQLEMIDAVCILGGEPTDQLDGLKELLEKLQTLPIEIWLYTGHDANYINDATLLELCDVIKCGAYSSSVPKKPDSRLASGNQYFIFNDSRRSDRNAD